MRTNPIKIEDEIAALPRLKHTIKLYEDSTDPDHFLILDISDETGGLGLRLHLHSSTASALGTRMADRARLMSAKAADDNGRQGIDEFTSSEFENILKPWRGALRAIDAKSLNKIICSEPGCKTSWKSPEGLRLVGGEWKCAAHRKEFDHDSHRLDLKEAIERKIASERDNLISLLNSTLSRAEIIQKLRAS